jgi:hypothetical protein
MRKKIFFLQMIVCVFSDLFHEPPDPGPRCRGSTGFQRPSGLPRAKGGVHNDPAIAGIAAE